MTDSPILILLALCFCWPGILPVAAAALLARRYNFRNPFVPRRRPEGEGDI